MGEVILKTGDKVKIPTTFSGGIQVKVMGMPMPLVGNGLGTLDGKKVVRQVDTDDFFLAAVLYDRAPHMQGMGQVSIKPKSVKASAIATDMNEPLALADSGYEAQLKITVPAIKPGPVPEADPKASVIATAKGTFEPAPKLKITSK